MNAPGRRLADRYELEERLGRGGMGEVWRARDERLGRVVAIKFLDGGSATDAAVVERFRREARILASLNHPNVVAVHDVDEHGDEHYLVMEHVAGPSLEDVLLEEGPLDLPRVAAVVGDVCGALEAAHTHGIVHRDIKPSNILFAEDGEVKLADFGIAKQLEASATGSRYGSAPYVAPEQAEGTNVDHRADVYGLGCVMYEMLAGRPPFTGDSAAAVVYQQVHAEPEALSVLRPGLPDPVYAVVAKALEKGPDDRFESAADLREALAAAVEGSSLEATQLLADATTAALGAGAGGIVGAQASEASAAPEPAPEDREEDREEVVVADTGSRGRPSGVLTAVGALVAVALVALLAVSLLPGGDPQQGDGEPTDEAAEGPPADAPPGEDGAQGEDGGGDLTVEEAVDRVAQLVMDGRAAGEMTDKGAEKLAKRAEEIRKELREGKLRDAHEEIVKTREELDGLVEDGEVSAEWAGRIRAALDDLERAMGGPPPPDEDGDDDGGRGEGRGEGRGRGDD